MDRNKSAETCQIRFEDGKTKWVKAAKLTGAIGSGVRGWLRDKAVDLAVDCVAGDACKSQSDK